MTSYYDRMPVLLRPEEFDAWLNGPLGADALKPASESALRDRIGEGDDDPMIVMGLRPITA